MSAIIVTTPEELRAIVNEAVSGLISKNVSEKTHIDTITLTDALLLLEKYGYPTSKSKMYKMTSAGTIPFKTYGNKLVFSRKELLAWAESQTKPKNSRSEIILILARSARRKK